MMIQTAPQGEKRFVSTMVEHLDLCYQFALAFGNDEFERTEPYEEFLYTVKNHDRGWDTFDANPVLDEKSGFPCGLGSGPVSNVVNTSKLSPNFNEAKHAYCGLLSSMHSWGLYNDRYGFSQFRVLDGGKSVPVPPGEEDTVKGLLDGEIERQARLKQSLSMNPETSRWIEEQNLFRNYKLLQFFDTLALYFNMRHYSEHTEETFVHVPKTVDLDVDITIKPAGDRHYSITPFPFEGDKLEVSCNGRYFEAVTLGTAPEDLSAMLYDLPTESQTFVFLN